MSDPLDYLQNQVNNASSWSVTVTMRRSGVCRVTLGRRPAELTLWPATLEETENLAVEILSRGLVDEEPRPEDSEQSRVSQVLEAFNAHSNGPHNFAIGKVADVDVSRLFKFSLSDNEQTSEELEDGPSSEPPTKDVTMLLGFVRYEGSLFPWLLPVSRSTQGVWDKIDSEDETQVTRLLQLGYLLETKEYCPRSELLARLGQSAPAYDLQMKSLGQSFVQSRIDKLSMAGEILDDMGWKVSLRIPDQLGAMSERLTSSMVCTPEEVQSSHLAHKAAVREIVETDRQMLRYVQNRYRI